VAAATWCVDKVMARYQFLDKPAAGRATCVDNVMAGYHFLDKPGRNAP